MEQFIDDLLAARRLPEDLDPEVRAQLHADLLDRATVLLNKRLIDALPEDSLDEFNRMADDDNTTPEAMQAFVAAHVTDVNEVSRQALLEFRAMYLGE